MTNGSVTCSKKGHKVCTPLACWLGAKPPPHEVNTFDSVMTSLALGAAHPTPVIHRFSDTSDFGPQWKSYTIAASIIPCIVVLIGAIAVFASCFFIGAPPLKMLKRLPLPAPVLILILSLIVLVTIAVACLLRLKFERGANQQARQLLLDAGYNLVKVDKAIRKLIYFTDEFFQQVLEMETLCAWPMNEAVKDYIDRQGTNIETFNDTLSKAQTFLGPHPALVQKANDDLSKFDFWVNQIPMIPMLLMFAFALFCIVSVCFTACNTRQSAPYHCVTCMTQHCLSFSACCNLVFVILGGALIFYAIMLSGFCMNPDGNLLNFVYSGGGGYGTRPSDSDFVNHYLADEMPNPLLLSLIHAEDVLIEINNVYNDLKWLLDGIYITCPAVHVKKDIGALLEEPLTVVNGIIEMFKAYSVYPAYVTTRTLVCEDTPGSVAIVAAFTSTVAVFLLPCLLCLTALNLGSWFEGSEYVRMKRNIDANGDPDEIVEMRAAQYKPLGY